MTSYLDRLNLRPQERRLVVIAGVAVFIVLNWAFVVPRFKDWSTTQDKTAALNRKLKIYQAELARVTENKTREQKLIATGSEVQPAEQAILLQRTLQSLVQSSHIIVRDWGKPTVVKPVNQQTNVFFEELNQSINITAGEGDLVDFFFNLGADKSMIRVGGLELYPATAGTNLEGRVTLVASYPKKVEPKAKPAATAAVTPAKKP